MHAGGGAVLLRHLYLSRMKLCTMAISLSMSTASWLQSTSSR